MAKNKFSFRSFSVVLLVFSRLLLADRVGSYRNGRETCALLTTPLPELLPTVVLLRQEPSLKQLDFVSAAKCGSRQCLVIYDGASGGNEYEHPQAVSASWPCGRRSGPRPQRLVPRGGKQGASSFHIHLRESTNLTGLQAEGQDGAIGN